MIRRYGLLLAIFYLGPLIFLAGCSSDDPAPVEKDETPPEIAGHFPALNETDVSRIGPYWIAFSEPMDAAAVEAGLVFTPGFACNLFWSGDTLYITPTALLNPGAAYSIVIDGASEDLAGNALGADYAIPFTTTTTNDYLAPEITGTVPADGAADVNGIAVIEISFNEPMNQSSAEGAVQSFPPLHDTWFEWESLTMKVHHAVLPSDSLITVTVGTGAMDLSGNHLAASHVFSFRTRDDDARPYLVSASPSNDASSVPTDLSQVVLTFSEPMDMNSFEMPYECVDARFNQLVREEPSFSPDYSIITVPLARPLLPGCTYWIRFFNVTDGAGNVIDPNPTPYQFTAAGNQTLYPIINDAAWYYRWREGGEATRLITDFNQQGGTFDEVRLSGMGSIEEKVHLRKTSAAIQHLGRSEYEDGVFEMSMIWDDPIPYLKLPIDSYIGSSWAFATIGTINDTTSIDLSGTVEIEPIRVDLVSDELRGTFKSCCIHHLRVEYTISVKGIPVDSGSNHQIMWLAPGVGPVQIIFSDAGGTDTLNVTDWNM